MFLRYIVLKKHDEYSAYRSDYIWSDAFLASVLFAFKDFGSSSILSFINDWINDDNCYELYGNLARIKKMENGIIGCGMQPEMFDHYELAGVHRDKLLGLFEQWRHLFSKKHKKIILARDNDNIWVCEYAEFNKKYNLNLDKPFEFSEQCMTKGKSASPTNFSFGPFLISRNIAKKLGDKLEIIQNKHDKYGVIRINIGGGFVERVVFLWAWSLGELKALFDKLVSMDISRFDEHRVYWQGVLTIMNDDGYAITMVLDYAKQEIIAMYPARSNFY